MDYNGETLYTLHQRTNTREGFQVPAWAYLQEREREQWDNTAAALNIELARSAIHGNRVSAPTLDELRATTRTHTPAQSASVVREVPAPSEFDYTAPVVRETFPRRVG